MLHIGVFFVLFLIYIVASGSGSADPADQFGIGQFLKIKPDCSFADFREECGNVFGGSFTDLFDFPVDEILP